MVKVTLENVTKRFGDLVAVNSVNMEIKDKEFFFLLGPSGCGKTTTLNMIAGLEPITEGHIYFDDEPVDHIPPEKRDVAMVFQSYALYPFKNAFDNIAFPLKLRKIPKDEIKRRVKEVAELIGGADLLPKKPYEMSGGERQRIALARAIIRQPKVFLLDEPLSNIDAKLRVYMRAELIRLQKRLKTTTIYVTHDQMEAMTMADRIALMNDGIMSQIGEPLQIFEHPNDLFVSSFIGSPAMNFFDCNIKKKNRKEFLETAYFDLAISKDIAEIIKDQASSSELVLGVRPQNISVSKRRVKEGFETEVYAVEPLGTEIIIDIKIGDQIVKSVMPPSFSTKIGDMVWVNINKDKIHIFDKKTERCIL